MRSFREILMPHARNDRRERNVASISALVVLVVLATTGCQTFSKKQIEAQYGPSEGILETIAVLRRHIPDDTYRFPPGTDFSGRNVYRASLLRIESLERAEADALRSGYMKAVLLFAKGRALERLRAFDLAAQQYRESARLSSDLRKSALEGAAICERLHQASKIGLDLVDPISGSGVDPLPLDPAAVRLDLDERTAQLSLLESELDDTHYRWIAQEEIERADVIRAHYFVAMRFTLPDGTLVALQELQRVATRHGGSKNRLRHLLRLGDFYAKLSDEYIEAIPPETLAFDPARYGELSDAAIQLFELVGSHDGRPEKLEASRKLEAFLARTLTVDADRFDR